MGHMENTPILLNIARAQPLFREARTSPEGPQANRPLAKVERVPQGRDMGASCLVHHPFTSTSPCSAQPSPGKS